MFSPAFVIVKTWANPKWLNQIGLFHTMKHCAAGKELANLKVLIRRELQDIPLSEKARCYK